jgi:hypothetical protein
MLLPTYVITGEPMVLASIIVPYKEQRHNAEGFC